MKKLRNMAANELRTQLEYNAIALQAVATAKKYLDESAADTKKLQTVTVCPLS